MGKRVTIQDIADELGLSRNTVSKALNNSEGLAEATRTRIIQKAMEMGYKQFAFTHTIIERQALGDQLTIAVGEKRNEKDYTNFFDCIIWGKYGEVMQKYLQKGQKVALAGSLHYSSWNDPKTGYTKSRVEVYVRDIDTMGPPPARDATEYASGQQMPIAAAPPQVPAPEVYDEDIPF